MSGSFLGLEIGKRALLAQRAALNVVGNNIANEKTPGYTRQRINLVASASFPYPSLTSGGSYGQIGTGVDIHSITRLRDQFLDRQFREQNKGLGEWEVKENTYGQIERIMKEPSDSGIQTVISNFWNSWQNLSGKPADGASRTVVLENAKALTDTLHSAYSDLAQLQKDVDKQIEIKAGEIDNIVQQIEKLNQQIKEIVVHNRQPNDLLDQRDLLLDELSKMADITYDEQDAGIISLKIGGISVIGSDGKKSGDIKVEQDASGKNKVVVVSDDGTGKTTTTDLTFSSGEMKGLIDSRDTIVEEYIGKLNDFAKAIMEEINKIHKEGMDKNGVAGEDFFILDPANSTNYAKDIQLNPNINEDKIAVSSKDTATPPSSNNDGKNATAIAKKLGELSKSYSEIVGGLGVQSKDAQRNKANRDYMTSSVDEMRASISAVNPDEEMIYMIQFQQAYNAAARTITAMDEMLDKLINGTGVVGR